MLHQFEHRDIFFEFIIISNVLSQNYDVWLNLLNIFHSKNFSLTENIDTEVGFAFVRGFAPLSSRPFINDTLITKEGFRSLDPYVGGAILKN